MRALSGRHDTFAARRFGARGRDCSAINREFCQLKLRSEFEFRSGVPFETTGGHRSVSVVAGFRDLRRFICGPRSVVMVPTCPVSADSDVFERFEAIGLSIRCDILGIPILVMISRLPVSKQHRTLCGHAAVEHSVLFGLCLS